MDFSTKKVDNQAQSQRNTYIQDLFPQVKHLRYSYLKYLYNSLSEIPDHSDIDLLVDKSEIGRWLEILLNHASLKKYRVHNTSFAAYVELFFEDGSYLSVDLIFLFKWRKLCFMKPEDVLDQSVLNQEGIKVALPEHFFEYVVLFFTLNDCKIPQKYVDHFHSLNKVIQNSIRHYLSDTYELNLSSRADLADLRNKQEHFQQQLEIQPENRGLAGIRQYYLYVRDLFRRRTPTITFTGVDGAGKSTILENVKTLLTEKYRREVVVLRQRPSVLPILSSFKYGKAAAEQKAANTLPRQGTNKSRISSLLRFLWYYTDYIFGQWYIEWTYNRRGKVLLYDRYYYDYIIDSKRANIVLSSGLIKGLFGLVFKPELNILLYADPDLILSRKQELSREDIEALTERMLGLFNSFSQKYKKARFLPIENIHLQETLSTIEAAYVEVC